MVHVCTYTLFHRKTGIPIKRMCVSIGQIKSLRKMCFTELTKYRVTTEKLNDTKQK